MTIYIIIIILYSELTNPETEDPEVILIYEKKRACSMFL